MKIKRIILAAFLAAWLPACLFSARLPASQPEQPAIYSAKPRISQSSATASIVQTQTVEFSVTTSTTLVKPVLTGAPAVDGPVSLPPVTPGNLFSIREQIRLNSRGRQFNVTYCLVDTVALKLDFFLPESPANAAPLVILVHGGGWSEGDKGSNEGLTDSPALLAAGFAFASLDYRLAPQYPFPAMIQDVKCAVRFFRAHASELQIDPLRIGMVGPSAGGHLSSLAGVSSDEPDFEAGEYLGESSRVQADDPSFLILQGVLDRVVPLSQSQLLFEALTDASVHVELVVVKNGRHGFQGTGFTPTRTELTALIVQFFMRYLQP